MLYDKLEQNILIVETVHGSGFVDKVQSNILIIIRINNSQDKLEVNVRSHVSKTKGSCLVPYIKPYRITLKLSEFQLLEDVEKLTLGKLKRILENILPMIKINDASIQGKAQGLQIEWPRIEIQYEQTPYPGVKTVRKSISAADAIMYLLTYQPQWICKGSKDGKFKDRLIMGFANRDIVIYEGGGATYGIEKDGLQYYNTTENLLKLRKMPGVKYLCHMDKDIWKSGIKEWF